VFITDGNGTKQKSSLKIGGGRRKRFWYLKKINYFVIFEN